MTLISLAMLVTKNKKTRWIYRQGLADGARRRCYKQKKPGVFVRRALT
jgi:hypothetical protein